MGVESVFLIPYILLFLTDHATCISEDPDLHKNVSMLIATKGYDVEEYEVQTEDGYILGLQRIPLGKNGQERSENVRPVVFLQHGLLADSACWVLNFEETSLGFALADAGYDVWLGNSRGNSYSRKHITLDPKDSDFWKFTFDQMAKYDLPATIDFILNVTGQPNLKYIGHSQGTLIAFALLSENAIYNEKISILVALAPVAYLGHLKGSLRYLAKITRPFYALSKLFGVHEFLPQNSLLTSIGKMYCKTKEKIICKNLMFLLAGPSSLDQLNVTRMPVYTEHLPSGTSARNMIHFSQLINTNQFRKYSYGFFGNYKNYKQRTPPLYNASAITAKVALVWGKNDWLATPADVAFLKTKLAENVVVSDYQVPYDQWSHVDFVLAMNPQKYLYEEVFRLLKKY